ncbi:DUF2332 domain-containing protein [Nocardioides sp. InS609-2]|uniref:DUF2332 domain-containing protein n=1 Tax=Nocardioides sp. InS609-2 TaxID=2760705 RepID=UPI0020C0FDD7|nr:DUF2332 domain-containing protein [Nocardioides sp. InS609-2]
MELFADVTTQYADFATSAADSPCFEAWSLAVVDDPQVQEWVATLPGIKQQPNLVFAAARWHGVPAPGPYAGLREALLTDDGSIRATIMARATQTNEVGRLATLLPAFVQAAAGRPLALLEVGASAGLCLYPDRWSYAWPPVGALAGPGPELRCEVRGPMPVPDALPEVSWRGGLDLHPLSVTDADQMAWLANLVWPEQDDRRARLQQAIEIAAADPPQLVQGDLLEDLPALVDETSSYGEVVVFHSAVLAYVDEQGRRRFETMMAGLVADGRCHWVSNEGRRVHPVVTETGPELPADLASFVLGLDGQAVAWTHGHGASMRWLPAG